MYLCSIHSISVFILILLFQFLSFTGPRVVTIHGQPYHVTPGQEAPEGQAPQYAQLYILDTNEALQQRINDPRNVNLRPDIIQLLQDELLAVNPYAQQYQNMEYGSNPPETMTNCC